ncbi:hypothetical protein SAMN05444156_1332 [Verrucomicrobium sp. GAS474]|uniref:hypothetical protein n=1 Tax=Verrucomicrobium sp. GAS474 TaxID=1882831 RepID=UPI00087D4324|nr:hypothetical protein [Verrucomicrobium sp. GAS474]SDT99616.1 hypothetical protein SAMN05444156_1332 [Verrucomicrobium sp. GAS474]
MSGAGNSRKEGLPRSLPPSLVALWTAALIVLVGGLVTARHLPGEGFTALIQFSEEFTPRTLPALRETPHHVRPSGYDGQFYAQLALDPALRDPVALQKALDAPAYRARRVLMPALAAALGLGSPARTLDAYALLNPLFWLALVALLLRACRPLSLPAMACVTAVALSGGAVESIRLALTDLPAATLLLAAALLVMADRPKPLWAGLLGALAGLARDTAAAAAGFLLLPVGEWITAKESPSRRALFLRWAGAIALAALPVLAWAAYVAHVFPGSVGQGSGAHDNFAFPLAAALARAAAACHELSRPATPLFGQETFALWTLLGLHLQALYLLLHRRPQEALWRMALPFALLIWFLGPAVWSGYLAVARALLPLTVAFNLLLLPSLRDKSPQAWGWFTAGNFFSLFGIIKFSTYVS